MRVHELAKDLGVPARELKARLEAAGVPGANNNFKVLEDNIVAAMREAFAAPAAPAPPKPAAKPAPSRPAVKPPAPPPKPSRPPPPAAEDVRRSPAASAPPKAALKPAARAAARPAKAPPAPLPQKSAVKPARAAAPPVPVKTLTLKGAVLVKDLAEMLDLRPNQVIAELMALNTLASINERVDISVARKIAEKHGFKVEKPKRGVEKHVAPPRKSELLEDEEPPDLPANLLPRPPVVTFLGHVDHGKTSLLDRIRASAVAAGEHGGITQHIGASTVNVQGKTITFLDTPGHAAFTEMRARGANLTDLAVLVIAADDGVMPQTEEAIRHARAAGVTIMAAINKIDLPAANVDRAKQQLAGLGLHPDDWGGDVICCPVSAQSGEGIDNLLDMILLQAEMLELKANPNRRACGYVVEAQLEPGMGPTATLLVQSGTLRRGDPVVCGASWGRIKALLDDKGVKTESAGPSMPVKCLGLSDVPVAGAAFRVCSGDKIARNIAERSRRDDLDERRMAAAPRRASLDDLSRRMDERESVELRLILKADVQGSLAALIKTLEDIKSDKVALNILMSAVGNVTANDVLLAAASSAVILGFNVGMENGVSQMAKRDGVEIRIHRIIYELSDQVRDAMTGMLAPEERERVIGHALIKQVFSISKSGRVAGCLVTDGQIEARCRVRIKRGEEVLNENVSIVSLKRFQTDVLEVQQSQECGIRLDRGAEFQENDVLEFYRLDIIQQTL